MQEIPRLYAVLFRPRTQSANEATRVLHVPELAALQPGGDAREDLVAGIGQLLDERGRVYGFRDPAQQERRFGEGPHIFSYGLECRRLPPARKRLFEERFEARTKLLCWQTPDVAGVEDLQTVRVEGRRARSQT